VALVLIAGSGLVVLAASEVPRGTRVAGIDIGGRSREDAAVALRKGLERRASEPVRVRLTGAGAQETETVELDPAAAGLAVDVAATVARAAGLVDPVTALVGTRDTEPVVTVDTARLDAALQSSSPAVQSAVGRPAVRFEGLTPRPVYAAVTRGVDPEGAAAALRAGWLRADVVTVPVIDREPGTSRAELDDLVRDLARPAVASPVSVTTPVGTVTMAPAAIARALVLESDATGTVRPRVDPARLRAALAGQLRRVETAPRDAAVDVRGGRLVTTPSVEGRTVDMPRLAAALLPVLSRPAPRSVPAALTTTAPKVTTEQIAKLGIKERISTFTTYFPAGQDRTRNIRIMAGQVDGTLVLPGKTYSVNEATYPRSAAKGYLPAPTIVGGKLKNTVGGGVSQFATTLYNAVFFSGLRDDEHHPHGFYISRYPAGREATLYENDLDVRFTNDSPYAVLIDTQWTPRSITVSFWSTKVWDIRSVSGPRTNFRTPKLVYDTDPECIPSKGVRGFDIVVYRVFRKGGVEVKRERLFTRYRADDIRICGPRPTPSPSATPSPA